MTRTFRLILRPARQFVKPPLPHITRHKQIDVPGIESSGAVLKNMHNVHTAWALGGRTITALRTKLVCKLSTIADD